MMFVGRSYGTDSATFRPERAHGGFHAAVANPSPELHFAVKIFQAQEINMPNKETLRRAQRDKRQGKAASTQAGEFIREEMHHIREGKHGARSAKQAVAIGLSKARRAGVELPAPEKGTVPEKTRKSAKRAYELGHGATPKRRSTARRAAASKRALKREPRTAASTRALSRQAHSAARRRPAAQRSATARKAARTRQTHKRA
jgi:Family of unknown function (DUF6496)